MTPLNPYLRLEQALELANDACREMGRHGASDRHHAAAVRQIAVHLLAASRAFYEITERLEQ